MKYLSRLIATTCLAMVALVAYAEDAAFNFNIPAQPVSQVLEVLTKQTGVQPFFATDSVKNTLSPGVVGRYTLRQAVGKALSGTGLTFQFTADNAVAVSVIEKGGTLREVVVTDSPYVVPNATTATKTDTPLMQTPMTVEVLPRQILQEQGITSSGLTDALAYLGVQTRGMKDQGDYMIFRGFSSPTTLWNGFRIEDATPGINYANGGVWMDNVDHLEVMKGPSSILYGRSEPGGAVNVLTKRPEAGFKGEVNAGVGSWSNRWLGVDVTGSFNEDKTVLGRINIAKEDSDSWFRYGAQSHSQGIAPALEWRISPQTTLSFEGQYRNFEGGANVQQYIPIDPATGELVTVEPRDTMMPGNISQFKQSRTYVALDHSFDAEWSVSWKYMHNDANSPLSRTVLLGSSNFPLGPGQTSITAFENQNRLKTDATIVDVIGHIEAMGIKHTLLLGADIYKKQFDQNSGTDMDMNTYSASWATDYFNPSLPAPIALTDTWSLSNRESAWYVQDQMELPGNWHLLLGGRNQRIKEESTTNWGGSSLYEKSVFLPRLGLLWQAQQWLSTYYSYAENTGSSNGLDYTGTPIKPESSKQHEVGVKSTWLDERLSANLALFELTKFNIAAADPDPAHTGFNIGVGEVKSTGYELNTQGALTDNWNVLFNYSHTRPYVVTGASGVRSEAIVAGELLPYVSNDTASVWTSYKLPGEALEGWKVGGGSNWSSAPNMDATSSIKTKAYSVVSAFASYETKLGGHKTALQLNINNLFDKKYMTYQGDYVNGGANVAYGSWGTPRQVKLNAKVEF